MKKITIKRAAQLLGKGELYVRECIKDGSLPIGTATQLPGSERWNFTISPGALAEYLGCSVRELYDEPAEECMFTEEQIAHLTRVFERMLRGEVSV